MGSSRTLRRVILVILALPLVAHAQPEPAPDQPPAVATQKVSGRVIDAYGKPIAGATVGVEGGTVTVKTDKLGKFHLDDVPETASIVASKDNYQDGLGNITPGTTEIDDIVLITDKTETIEVSGEGPPTSPGAAKLDRSEMERVAGTGNDVVRTLSAMPGVVNFPLPLGYTGVVIRGSSPEDSKTLVDDFEIPTLYHDIGFRSIIPAEAIDKLDYIPGGFDVAYGRATSGIVSLTTRPGNEKSSEQLEASVIDSGALVQGLADGVRYMVGFRRSTIDLVLPEIIPASVNISLTTVPRYYDEQVRLDYQINDKWDARLSSVGSDDELEIFADKAQNADKRFYNRTRFVRVTSSAHYHDGGWTANLALSGLAEEFIFERGTTQFVDVKQPSVSARGEVTRSEKSWAGLTDVAWRLGAESVVGRNSLDIAIPQEAREGQPPPNMMDANDTSEKFNGIVWTPDFAAWTAVNANLDPALKVSLGLRADAFARIKAYSVEPRGELDIKLAPGWTERLSAGAYARPPEYQSELLASNVGPEKSTQLIAGTSYEPKEGVRAQASLYYTDRYDLLTYGTNGVSIFNQGRGTTVGAELLATYRDGPWFGFLSYSLSRSTRVDSPGAPERLFDFDQTHSLNLALSRRWTKWQVGGRFQLYSGLPFTPVIGSVFNSDTNVYQPVYGATNSERAPMHNQLDIRIDYYWKWGPVDMSWFLDVQNVYLNESIVAYFYNYDYTQQLAFKSLPIIPSIGVRGTF